MAAATAPLAAADGHARRRIAFKYIELEDDDGDSNLIDYKLVITCHSCSNVGRRRGQTVRQEMAIVKGKVSSTPPE